MPTKFNLFKLSISGFLILLLMGCSSAYHRPTQKDIDDANKICIDRSEEDKVLRKRNWFTNWLKCKQELLMPYDIELYPRKENEIRAMYRQLLLMGVDVDAGKSGVEKVYDEWDKMQSEIGMYKGLCLKATDGGQRCINPKSNHLFIQKKNGQIVPLD